MSITVTEKDLPATLTAEQAVEAAYSQELADVGQQARPRAAGPDRVRQGTRPVPVPQRPRTGSREAKLQCIYLDGRQRDPQQGAMPMGLSAP